MFTKPVIVYNTPSYPAIPIYPVIWPWSGSYNYWTQWNDSHRPHRPRTEHTEHTTHTVNTSNTSNTSNKMPVAPDPIIVKTKPRPTTGIGTEIGTH